MSTNGATKRLLRRLPPDVQAAIVEIADDVFAVKEQFVENVRSALSDQPQVGYFLDRDMRADEFYINALGDKAWALRGRDKPVVTRTILESQVFVEKDKDLGAAETIMLTSGGVLIGAGGLRLKGRGYKMVGVADTLTAGQTIAGREAASRMHVHGEFRTLGPYLYGAGVRLKSLNNTDVIESGTWNDTGWNGDLTALIESVKAGGNYTDVQGLSAGLGLEATATEAVPFPTSPELRKNLVVIAGPAVFEYAEFFPGFEFVISDYPVVAQRIMAVLDGVRAKHASSAEFAKAEEAVKTMIGKTGHKLVAFRGSIDYDPLKLWADTRVLPGVSLDKVTAEEGVITADELARAKTEWGTGRWMLSGYDPSDAGSLINIGMVGVKAGDAYSVKPASATTANVGVEGGLSAVEIESLSDVVCALKRAGAVLTWVDSPWLTNSEFKIGLYNAAKTAWENTAVGSTPPEPSGPIPDGSQYDKYLGRSICSRLLTSPVVTAAEELTIIPVMSPQYFWTQYARAAPELVPPNDVDVFG